MSSGKASARDVSATSRYLRLAFVSLTSTVVVLGVAGWWVGALQAGDLLAYLSGDWIQFHRTASRLVGGEWSRLYPDGFPSGHHPDFPDGLYFLYPPFALVFTAPLAALSPIGAYLACVALVLAGVVGALLLLRSALDATADDLVLVGLGVAASAFFLGGLALGHLSMLLVTAAAGALWLSVRRRYVAAGAVTALLLVKPNWGVPLGLLLVVGRCWPAVLGYAAAAVGLFLVGLALDHGLWTRWLEMTIEYGEVIRTGTPPQRQITLFASLQSILNRPGSDRLVQVLWWGGSIALVIPTAVLWWTARRRAIPWERLWGVALVVVLAVNPYAYFYDGVLLAVPGAVWWMRRKSYRSRGAWATVAGVLALLLVWEHLLIWPPLSPRLSPAGAAIGVWGAAELFDLYAGPSARTTISST